MMYSFVTQADGSPMNNGGTVHVTVPAINGLTSAAPFGAVDFNRERAVFDAVEESNGVNIWQD